MSLRVVASKVVKKVSLAQDVLAAAGTAAFTPACARMGRYGKNKPKNQRTQKKDFGKGKRSDEWTDYRNRNTTWDNIDTKAQEGSLNEEFEEYYKGQKVCPEDEWDRFIFTLRDPLPIAFRINGSGALSEQLKERLQRDYFSKFADGQIVIEEKACEAPRPMPWYPRQLAWQMGFSRMQLRKVPILAEMHEFIKRETAAGSISRQEAVSMVPPLFLDVQPHHIVLDVCAAPGSKTFQILEMLHSGSEPATGLVVANDADVKRCNLLTHQTKRMCSPSLLVCNHEGQMLPLVRPRGAAKLAAHGTLRYDRVLCDVPCSGDGTLRKAPDIWRRWRVGNGNGLHALQLRITLQSCRLLKVGGRLVYSTCTFNPIEDEAVVAAVLQATKGAMRLLDVSADLPKLKRLPGLSTWKVKDKGGWHEAWEDVRESVAEGKAQLDPTMFPPAADAGLPLERCMRFLPHHQDTGGFFVAVLEKVRECADLDVPTMEHRGKGKKGKQGKQSAAAEAATAEPAQPQTTPATDAAPAAAADSPPTKRVKVEPAAETTKHNGAEANGGADGGDVELRWEVRGGGRRGRPNSKGLKRQDLDPVIPVTDDSILGPVKEFYGLEAGFPLSTHLVTRCMDAAERPKRCYYVSDSVRRLLMMDESESLTVIQVGLKLLERQEVRDGSSPCIYRIAQEGLPFLLPHITKQRVRAPLSVFKALLQARALRLPHSVPYKTVLPPREDKPKVEGEEAKPAGGVGLEGAGGASETPTLECESCLAQVAEVNAGCCIITLTDEDARRLGLPVEQRDSNGGLAAEAPLAMSCWRTRGALSVLVSKEDCAVMLDRLDLIEGKAAQAVGGDGGDEKPTATAEAAE